MSPIAEVVIVGAGPYGLSLAAHLAARGLKPLVFGRLMESWSCGAPRGMRLKSEGFASSLSEPTGRFTLKAYCEDEGLVYADFDCPTPVSTFIAYCVAFQKRFVPQLDSRMVRDIREAPGGFSVQLEDGAMVHARQVIVATGLSSFAKVPAPLRNLSSATLTHASELSDYSRFRGAKVLVVGSGASATDAAAELLHEGADVTLTCRAPQLRYFSVGKPRRWFDPLIAPRSPVGPGWKKWIVTRFPAFFHWLPEGLRVSVVNRTLGPASAWFIRKEIEGKIEVIPGCEIVAARETPSGVEVEMKQDGGAPIAFTCDHVLAGTGYRVDIRRLTFLDPRIVKSLALLHGAPKLTRDFETSVPGLYFVGVSAAYNFGPLLRFVCGADFAAHRASAAIAAASRRTEALAAPSAGDTTADFFPSRPKRHRRARMADGRD
jgi:thioredoxin reductase